jgi:DNA polymerase-3 subunit gamma/tau
MTYLALARQYRPKTFDTMVGQEAVVVALKNALDRNKIHHAYLFTGTRGVGKTTLARLFAKCLNCKQGISANPCGQCDHCKEMDGGNFIDLFEIDAASRTKVEDTRDLLDNVPYAPSKGRYKVYLIDEVHMLSTHSFNALLKTLEEPPAHVIFILATTETDKLPATILSRCLQFHLLHLQPEEIEKQLKIILDDEKITYEDEALRLIAQAAQGSMRDGLSLLDQALAFSGSQHLEAMPLHQLYGSAPSHIIQQLWQAVQNKQYPIIKDLCQSLAHSGVNFSKLLNQLIEITYDKLLSSSETQKLQLARIYDGFIEGKSQIFHAPSLRMGFEMCLFKAAAFSNASPTLFENPAPLQTQAIEKTIQKSAQETTTSTQTIHKNPPSHDLHSPTKAPSLITLPISDWTVFLNHLNLKPATKLLATNCTLQHQDKQKIQLLLANKHKALLNHQQIKNMEDALCVATGIPIKVNIQCQEEVTNTPHQQDVAFKNQLDHNLRKQLNDDLAVKALKDRFGASIESVKPLSTEI